MRIKVDILLKVFFLPVEYTLLPSSYVTWILTGWLDACSYSWGLESSGTEWKDTCSSKDNVLLFTGEKRARKPGPT